jgi:hypothetical protein
MNRIILLLGLLTISVSACQESGCVEISRTKVTDPQEPVFIGGTYGEVLATVVGERSGTLKWEPSEQFVRGFPPAGEVGLTVTVHEPSMAWDIEIEKRARRNERLLCTHLLETELEIELRSDDGVLDLNVVAPVTIDNPDSVQIYTDVTENDLGTLQFDPINEDASLRLRLFYSPHAVSEEGALVLSTSSSDDGGSGAGMTVELATWTLE